MRWRRRSRPRPTTKTWRNLTDAEILRCVEALDKRKDRGSDQERDGGKFQPKAQPCANGEPSKSAEKTAASVDISLRQAIFLGYPRQPRQTSARSSAGSKLVVVMV